MQGYYYLATPHSHEEQSVREMRTHVAAKAVYMSMLGGVHDLNTVIYSPIMQFHWAHEKTLGCLKPSFARYVEYDYTMIANSRGLLLLPLRDNFQSVGVQSEIAFAKSLSIPIWVLALSMSPSIEEPFHIHAFSPKSFQALDADDPQPWETLDREFSKFLKVPTYQG